MFNPKQNRRGGGKYLKPSYKKKKKRTKLCPWESPQAHKPTFYINKI
jgi:hypothetical protein